MNFGIRNRIWMESCSRHQKLDSRVQTANRNIHIRKDLGMDSQYHGLLWPPAVKASLEEDFPSLALSNPERTIYLDTVGASLYSRSQLNAAFEDLKGNIFSNPHSCSETRERVNAARRLVLGHLGVSDDEYAVVFTSGSTAALKLLGESFHWSEESTFAYRVAQ